jgi:ubiquinone/menaquinone biosynthesis C-methylase UbiE
MLRARVANARFQRFLIFFRHFLNSISLQLINIIESYRISASPDTLFFCRKSIHSYYIPVILLMTRINHKTSEPTIREMTTSSLQRVLEEELMDTAEEAIGYDAMDHSVVNARFVADFLAEHGSSRGGWYIDIGTGTALIPLILATTDRSAQIKALDAASHMLTLARNHVEKAGLSSQIELVLHDAKKVPFPDGSFEAVISNSIVHHIPSPEIAITEMVRLVAPGGTLFVRDLARPVDQARLDSIVNRYAADAPAIARAMFADSLHAALTTTEVADILEKAGLPRTAVAMTSDRHWTIIWQRPF